MHLGILHILLLNICFVQVNSGLVKGSGGTQIYYSDDGREVARVLAFLIRNFYFYLKTDSLNIMLKVEIFDKKKKNITSSHAHCCIAIHTMPEDCDAIFLKPLELLATLAVPLIKPF